MSDKHKAPQADKQTADTVKPARTRGDRIVQIILLLLIASGIGGILWLNLPGDNSRAGGAAGQSGYSARPGGAPSGSPPSGSAGRTGGGRPSGAGGSGGVPAGPPAIAVETVPVERKDVSQYIRVNGDVILDNQVEIYSDTGGRLVELPLQAGDRVSVNQLIARVDPSLPGQNYSVSAVRSTIGGTVLTLPLQVGDKVTTQNPLAVIGNMEQMKIQTYIPEKFIAGLSPGLPAEVSFDALPGETFSALISEINPVMDTATRTLAVKLQLTRRDSRIRPGMFASMKLITRRPVGIRHERRGEGGKADTENRSVHGRGD